MAAWRQVLHESYGVPFDPMVVKLNEGRPVIEIARAVTESCGLKLDEDRLEALIRAKNERFRGLHRPRLFPEILQIIAAAKERGIAVGLVTGTKRENLVAVVDAEVLGQLDVIIADGDTARGKPWPDPYLEAAGRLGVPPAACLVVENAPQGIRAAKAAGMFCVAVMTTLKEEHLQEADVTVPTHADLLRWFRRSAVETTDAKP
ncbi:MAG: HAD-IA family hydrolase [candidate division KSB1 bacterium]|nr:HAD-IA family hydrolase [candidate division KSB1 bacterium]